MPLQTTAITSILSLILLAGCASKGCWSKNSLESSHTTYSLAVWRYRGNFFDFQCRRDAVGLKFFLISHGGPLPEGMLYLNEEPLEIKRYLGDEIIWILPESASLLEDLLYKGEECVLALGIFEERISPCGLSKGSFCPRRNYKIPSIKLDLEK